MYFQNEIWDTGGDGRISITGDIYSQADPFSIYINATPLEVIEFSTAMTEIKNNLNVLGNITANGQPISTLTEDLVPGIFGDNEAPGTFSFENGLNVTGLIDITHAATPAGIYVHSPSFNQAVEFTIDDIGTTTGAGLQIYSNTTQFGIVVDDDSVTPANSYTGIFLTKKFEITGQASIDINAATTLNLDGPTGITLTTGGGSNVVVNGVNLTPDSYALITKSANQDVTNTTTVADDTELKFAVVAGKTYSASFRVIYSGSDGTGDFKWELGVSAGTMTGRGFALYHNAAQTFSSTDLNALGTATTAQISNGTNGPVGFTNNMTIDFSFQVSNTGTFVFRFANVAAGVGRVSRAWAGSTLRWKQLD